MPQLARIAIYPLKSFDPLRVEEAVVLPNGALQYDRQFALIDQSGKFLNAKRTPAVHGLELVLDPVGRSLAARRRGDTQALRWQIDDRRDDLQRWLSNYFSLDLRLIESPEGGFPDDIEATGPTIVSVATLQAVTDWFPGLTLDNVRRRFRANLEVEGVEPFWEDRLFRADSTPQPFRIGSAMFDGTNPCQRCVVPSRDPSTGEVWPEFSRRFAKLREQHLPPWAACGRFNHFYRLSTNTRGTGSTGGIIRVGDSVKL